jgi:hypothetical protein
MEAKQARLDAREAAKDQGEDVKRSAQAADRSAKAAERSADIAAESLKDSRRGFQISERPWLNVTNTNVTLPPDGGRPPRFDTTLTNSGKSPAYNVRVRQWVFLADTISDKLMPEPSSISTSVVAPASYVIMTNSPTWVVTPEQFKDIVAKKLFLCFHGIAEYDDVFGKRHLTKWCAYTVPDKTAIYPCTTGNSAN